MGPQVAAEIRKQASRVLTRVSSITVPVIMSASPAGSADTGAALEGTVGTTREALEEVSTAF